MFNLSAKQLYCPSTVEQGKSTFNYLCLNTKAAWVLYTWCNGVSCHGTICTNSSYKLYGIVGLGWQETDIVRQAFTNVSFFEYTVIYRLKKHETYISTVLYSKDNENTSMGYLFPKTSGFYAVKPIFDFVAIFSRSIQLPCSLKSWHCGLLMKQSSFLLTKLKLCHKKWIPSKRPEKRHLIYNRIRLRDEFLLTHCWGEMFDLQHYVQSGGKILYISLEENNKINRENVSQFSFETQSNSSNFTK